MDFPFFSLGVLLYNTQIAVYRQISRHYGFNV